MNKARVVDLVQKLIELTNQNKLKWRDAFLGSLACKYEDWDVLVEWLQDDKPTIYINDSMLSSYGYNIENLMQAVRLQIQKERLEGTVPVQDLKEEEFYKVADDMLKRLNSIK